MGAGLDYMHSRGIVDAAIIAAVGPTLDSGRVWLPWRDADNQQIYSTGRTINGGEPKYKNQAGPKPPLFATPAAWQSPEVVLVEGQFDALAAAQAGTPAFATTTSFLSDEAIPILRAKKRVILVPDNDEAGFKWKEDVVLKLAHLVDLYEVRVPEGCKDLADVAERAEGDPGDAVFDVLETRISLNRSPFVDWDEFWRRPEEPEWLYEPFLARGRGHALYAEKKTGKSLFVLETCGHLWMQGDTVIVYLDYEMGEDDLKERLLDMGFGPSSDLSLLNYAILPDFAPLNTSQGASELLHWVDALRQRHPDKHMVVIIDTISRAVTGRENDPEPIQDFYHHTGIALKQRRLTWLRADHAGKDPTKGQRGHSTKGDDVDVIWRLSRVDQGYRLKSDGARMSWVPDEVIFRRLENPLRLIEVDEAWPTGTSDIAAALDSLDVDITLGERPAGEILRAAGHSATQNVLRKALKFRRMQARSVPTGGLS